MKRTPEPEELMDEADQALAYAQADFSESNELFLELFSRLHPEPFTGRMLDLGCGPADIPLRFARRHPGARIDALDGARAMLDLAQQAIEAEGLEQRIRLHCQYLPATGLAGDYDAVVSNSLLHHLNDPLDLWRTIAACGASGAHVLVMDLLRPDSPERVDALVAQYAADAPEVLRRDFHASLHAAYTLDEVREQLARCDLDSLTVEQVSDRHLAVMGRLP
ncbi:class I SAM-dependent methyltransferase [Thiolapillus sp.]